VLQELPVDIAGHRSPLDADERRRTPSSPPSPSRRPRGESPVSPQCPAPLQRPPGARRLDLVTGQALPDHRQACHCARIAREDHVVSALGAHTPAPRLWAEWSAQHCAPVFRFSFSFKKFRNCCKLLKYLENGIQL
jgi:hypothetical protein